MALFSTGLLLIFTMPFPKQVEFYDNVASVSALSFTDQDADAEEIGGQESRSDESSNMSLFGSRKIRDVLSISIMFCT